MDVLMTSTSYPIADGGWQGVFIKHLTDSLAKREDLKLKLWSPPGLMPENVDYLCSESESAWLTELIKKGGIAQILRNKGISSVSTTLKLLYLLHGTYHRAGPDTIFHINWLQNALPLLNTKQPALITVLGTDFKLLNLPGMTTALRHVLRCRKTILAPNAEWMLPKLKEKFGDIADIQFIPLGIDDTWYELDRAWHELKTKKWYVVLRITQKKIGPLFDWGSSIFQNNGHELHLVGPLQEPIILPDWVCYHGPATPQELLERHFPSAAGLITLSQHDEGRPQVILEAMASGIPVIASPIPAHLNIIEHKKTGWIVNNKDDLVKAITSLDNYRTNHEIGVKAKQNVMTDIGTWDDCARRYAAIYQKLYNGDLHQ